MSRDGLKAILPDLEAVANGAGSGRIRVRTASTITARRVEFLDQRRTLPRASLAVLAGRPGLGKTILAGKLSADITTGVLPGVVGPGNVLYCTGEDDAASVLVPRLMAADANLDRVHFVSRAEGPLDTPLVLPEDVAELVDHAKAVDAVLCVIDPISAFLSGKVDSHRDADVRGALAPLASLASEVNLTVLAVAHLKKGKESDPLSRVSGSGAFGAAPRSVLILGSDPGDENGDGGNRRVLAHAKCNVAPLAGSLALHIEEVDIDIDGAPYAVPVLREDGDSDHSAADILDVPTEDARSVRDEAKEWLVGALEHPVRSKELKSTAKDAGLSTRTLERAKKDLEIKADQGADGWYWLPPGQTTLEGES